MLSWLHYWPQRSLGKNVHLNRPGKKQKSGFGLHPIAVTNIILKKTHKFQTRRPYFLQLLWRTPSA